MGRRRAQGRSDTPRKVADKFRVMNGAFLPQPRRPAGRFNR